MKDKDLVTLVKELNEVVEDMKAPPPTQGNKIYNMKRLEKVTRQITTNVTGHGTGGG